MEWCIHRIICSLFSALSYVPKRQSPTPMLGYENMANKITNLHTVLRLVCLRSTLNVDSIIKHNAFSSPNLIPIPHFDLES